MDNVARILPIPNAFEDHRGTFDKIYDSSVSEFFGEIRQVNIVQNLRSNTFRGLHLQKKLHAENKLIFVNKGSIIDIVVCIDSNSSDYLNPQIFKLGDRKSLLFVPNTYLHGYLTIEDETEVVYLSDASYFPGCQYSLNIKNEHFEFEYLNDVVEISDSDKIASNIFDIEMYNKCQCS